MTHKKIAVEIVSTDKTTVSQPKEISGWGDEATQTTVEGQIAEITISRDGKRQFGFYIGDDGSIILTDYGGMFFQMNISQNMKLYPSRKWEKSGE